MKRWALIQNNIVTMIVEQDTIPTVFAGGSDTWVDVTGIFVGPGFILNGESFSPPPKVYNRIDVINLLGNKYNSIVTASKSDIDLEIWLEKFRLLDTFNTGDDAFKQEIELLVTKNILSPEKANTLLGV